MKAWSGRESARACPRRCAGPCASPPPHGSVLAAVEVVLVATGRRASLRRRRRRRRVELRALALRPVRGPCDPRPEGLVRVGLELRADPVLAAARAHDRLLGRR
jgi:hypothetical protein